MACAKTLNGYTHIIMRAVREQGLSTVYGGGGIRTRETHSKSSDFTDRCNNRSATPPSKNQPLAELEFLLDKLMADFLKTLASIDLNS